jgi:hypothetical protein
MLQSGRATAPFSVSARRFNTMHRSIRASFTLLLGWVAIANAQSVNIDFGSPGSAPPANYAAAGSPGTWNVIGVLPSYQRQPLVGPDGLPSGLNIYMAGGTQLLDVDDGATFGPDQSLLDDMLIGFNNPIDVCIWIENLPAGDYEVLTYAMTPANAMELHRVRVDDGNPGPTYIGGGWPGMHVQNITFARHRVYISNGYIGLHSGLYNANYRSGINGLQVRPVQTDAPPPGTDGRAQILGIYPNPAPGAQLIELHLNSIDNRGALEIFDAAGRVVWRRALESLPAGQTRVEWNGRDLAGQPVPAAVYFVRLGGRGDAAEPRVLKLVRSR